MNKNNPFFLTITIVVISMSSFVYAATPTFYTDRATFEAALGTFVTDDYSPASGYPGGFIIVDNTTMSGYFGETDYQSTGFTNHNLISGDAYCAGCNGSFLLGFNSTAVTENGIGVFGVGLDIRENISALPYFAYITYGDATTESVALPTGASFFGVIAPELIQSIHFGLSGGGSTQGGSFQMDNLTIGNQQAEVPQVAVPTLTEWGMIIFIMLAGFGGIMYLGKLRRT